MKYKGTLMTNASGSIGGLTASHNRGGAYFRQRVVPVNSNTVQQQAVRAIFGQLSSLWISTLTQAQRDGWEAYALGTPIPDPLGDPRNIGGLAMYVRCNTPRLQAGKTRIDAPPTILGVASLSLVTHTVGGATTTSIAFVNTDAWAGAAGGHLFVYFSRGQNATTNYFKGPYRFAIAINGAGTPPTSPQAATLPFAVVAGQKVFLRAVASNADGRLSNVVRTVDVF